MRLMLTAKGAKLLHFQPLSCRSLVFRLAVVPVLALVALKLNDFSWHVLPNFRKG
jgi:hypothetical protein